jgi:hypothetical protein
MLDNAQATHGVGIFGGGRQMRIASGLRFCTIAVRWNSSRAPERMTAKPGRRVAVAEVLVSDR